MTVAKKPCFAEANELIKEEIRTLVFKNKDRLMQSLVVAGLERPERIGRIIVDGSKKLTSLMEEEIKSLTKEFKAERISVDQFQKRIEEEYKKHLIEINKSLNDLTNSLIDFTKKVKNPQNLEEVIGATVSEFTNRLNYSKNSANLVMLQIRNSFEGLRKNLNAGMNNKSVTRAAELFEDLVSGGSQLKNLVETAGYNFDSVMMRVLATGTGPDIAGKGVLHAIGAAMKQVDAEIVETVTRINPTFKGLEVHIGKLSPNVELLQANFKNADEFAHWAAELVDPNSIERFRGVSYYDFIKNPMMVVQYFRSYYNWLIDTSMSAIRENKGIISPRAALNQRRFHFKDADSEMQFYSKTQNFEERGVIGAKVDHWQKLYENVHMIEQIGKSVPAYADSVAEIAKTAINTKLGFRGHKAASAIDSFHSEVAPIRKNFEVSPFPGSKASTDAEKVNRSLLNVSSAILTDFGSPVRNIAWDYGGFKGLQKALLTGKSPLLGTIKGFIQNVQDFMNWGKVPHEDLEFFLKSQKMSVQYTFAQRYNAWLQVNQRITNYGKSPFDKALKGTDFMRNSVNKLSLADRSFRAGRNEAIFWSMNLMQELSRRVSRGGKLTAFQKKMLLDVGLDETDLKAIFRKAKTVKLNGETATIDLNSLLNKETGADNALYFKTRTAIEKIRQFIAPEHERYGIGSIKKHANPAENLILSNVYQFLNITFAAFSSGRQGMLSALGGHNLYTGTLFAKRLDKWLYHNTVGLVGEGLKHSPVQTAEIIMGVAAGGYSILWLMDLLSNKTPRPITPQSTADAMLITGMGGPIGAAIEAASRGRSPVSFPIESVAKKGKRLGKGLADMNSEGKAKAWSAFVGLNPWADLPYTRAATDLLRQELGIKRPRFEKQLMKEYDQKPLIKTKK